MNLQFSYHIIFAFFLIISLYSATYFSASIPKWQWFNRLLFIIFCILPSSVVECTVYREVIGKLPAHIFFTVPLSFLPTLQNLTHVTNLMLQLSTSVSLEIAMYMNSQPVQSCSFHLWMQQSELFQCSYDQCIPNA